MKNTLSFVFYLFCCFAFPVLQTTVVPESSLGRFTPNLNLILVICLAFEDSPYLFIPAALNGLLVGALTSTVGIYIFVSLTVFFIARIAILNIRWSDNRLLSLSVMLSSGTLLMDILFKVFAERLGQADYPYLNIELFIHHTAVNTVFGIPVIIFLRKVNAFIKR